MRRNTCFAFFLLALAVAQAIPSPKLHEKKSDLKIEGTGNDKDRSKKSATFCVEIRPGSSQPTQIPCDQQNTHSAQLIQPTQPVQPVQTLNLVQPAPQTVQPVQTLSLVPQQVAQLPQQTYSFVQPAPQPAPQPSSSSIVIPAPQQPVHPVHTLHIMQPAPQPCAQPAQVSILQPVPQPTQTLNIIQPAPQPAPEPAPAPTPAPEPVPAPAPEPTPVVEVIKPVPEQPKPAQVVNIIQPVQPMPEPTETLNVLPVAPACNEQVVVVPSNPLVLVQEPEKPQLAAVVQIPSVSHQCHHQHHALVTECNCQPKNVLFRSSNGMEPMHGIGMRERSMFRAQKMDPRGNMMPMMMYPGAGAKSQYMLLNRGIRSEQESKDME